jgi:hypothetical protein
LNFEAILLSVFFIVSITMIILRGFREIRKIETAEMGLVET